MLRNLLICFAALLLGTIIRASGISTHFEAADRAVAGVNLGTHPDLAATLNHWPETVRVGAVYPDWGYLWNHTSAAAEDAHWAPFHTVALGYLHNTYGEPWNAHAERLYCFIAGMACHGTMDDAWHFGRTSFLQQAMGRDLQGTDPGQAETMIEVFTDLFVQKDHRPDYEREPWWIPADDLVVIHQLAGHSVMRGGILRGTTIQRIGFLIENVAWVFAEETAAEMLPWTRDNYLTWHDGGLINGADLSALRMQDLWDEYQAIAASQPNGGKNNVFTHSVHQDHIPRQLWLEAAERLLDQGAVRVPVKELVNGAVELGTPVVVEPKKLLQEIIEISRSF